MIVLMNYIRCQLIHIIWSLLVNQLIQYLQSNQTDEAFDIEDIRELPKQ